MRKNLLSLIMITLLSGTLSVQAQFTAYCGSARYDQEVFSNVLITPNIVYGSNTDYTGAVTTLTMDIYEPDGDTAAIRPLIVWAHGGSFLGGTKNDGDVTSLCNHFAKRGYVCVSINYRLGIPIPPNQAGATQAVYRAVQDMKAAIRYFRQDAATSNTYRIDPSFIVAAGSSAGAFTALHLAYLNLPSELPSQIDTTVMGGMEGNSGNPGYSSTVNAVVNLCGALGNKTWMVPGDVPLCSMHGTIDNVVPYATAMLYVSIFPIMVVDGSYTVNAYANTINVPNEMFTYYGQNHVPYASSTAYMDTTVRFVSNFLYRYMGCTPVDPIPYANTFPSTGINTAAALSAGLNLYPNPSSETVYVDLKNGAEQFTRMELFDLSGRKVKSIPCEKSTEVRFEKGSLNQGLYLLHVLTNQGEYVRKLSFD